MTKRYAWYMLFVLTAINFINYVDRQIIISLGSFIRRDLQLSYAEFGWLITAFMLIHSLTSVPLGLLSDRGVRRKIIALGVACWSAATFISGLVTTFPGLLTARAVVGVGEAAYAPPANSLLSDAFTARERSRILGIFNLGMFAGAALGLSLGGILGEQLGLWICLSLAKLGFRVDGLRLCDLPGWRLSLYLASLPGFLLAGLVWKLREPPIATKREKSPGQAMVALFRNATLMYVCGGGVIAAFSVGALVVWMPQYLIDIQGYRPGEAGLVIGITGATAGLLGVLIGSSLADWLYGRWPWGRLAVIGAGLILSSPFVIFALYATSRAALTTHIFFAIFFMVWYTGPIIAVIHEVVPTELKATAQGLYIFLIHLFGDTPSPWIVGWLADSVSLRTALLPLPILNVIGGIIFLVGCRRLTYTTADKQANQLEAQPLLPRTGTLDR